MDYKERKSHCSGCGRSIVGQWTVENLQVTYNPIKCQHIRIRMVANLDKLPPAGAMVYGAPIKIKDGTGGASRIFADIGKHEKCDKQRTEVFLTHIGRYIY